MVKSKAKTVKEYIESLPPERAEIVKTVRKVILKNLPKGYEENMNWGAICYEIPLKTYPNTYNKQPLATIGLSAQKNNYSLYMMGMYWGKKNGEWFRKELEKSKIKLPMGAGCVRFTKLEGFPLELIGKAVARVSVKDYIKDYEENMKSKGRLK